MQNVEYVNCYFFASEEEYNTHECLFEFMTDRQTDRICEVSKTILTLPLIVDLELLDQAFP